MLKIIIMINKNCLSYVECRYNSYFNNEYKMKGQTRIRIRSIRTWIPIWIRPDEVGVGDERRGGVDKRRGMPGSIELGKPEM